MNYLLAFRKYFILRRCAFLLIYFSFIPILIHAESPYGMQFPREFALVASGTGFCLVGYQLINQGEPLNRLDIDNLSRSDLNSLDRIATYQWSKSADAISDYLLYINIALPLVLMLDNNIRNDFEQLGLMYFQNLSISAGLSLVLKGIFDRSRPLCYNENVPLNEKTTLFARRSFPSGHSTLAFASAVFFAKVYNDYFNDSEHISYVWGGALIAAGLVGTYRILAGVHFPSDVIAGALIGSAIGYAIPEIHRISQEFQVPTDQVFIRRIPFSFNF